MSGGFAAQRDRMVDRQIAERGVRDPLVLDAMRRVPREAFVPERERTEAYRDHPLPIAGGQTISQPYVVALMVEALGLGGGEKVLEVGAGSGYAAAVVAEIADEVFAIERIGELAVAARANLADQGYANAHVIHADGTKGLPEEAPFDAILVSARTPTAPARLLEQLAPGGRMVVPVGLGVAAQSLMRITRVSEDDYRADDLGEVWFVPLIGEEESR